jgi:hypothetical protein
MNKSIILVALIASLSTLAFACGGDGGNNTTDAGDAATTEDAETADAGDAGPTCIEDPTTIQAQATFTTNLRFLNQCTTSQFRDFNNTVRIQHPLYVPGGPYPAF